MTNSGTILSSFTLRKSLPFLKTHANHLTDIPNLSPLNIFKQMQILAIGDVVTDSSVPSHKGHVANLAFAGIKEYAFIIPTISVTVLMPLLSGKEQ